VDPSIAAAACLHRTTVGAPGRGLLSIMFSRTPLLLASALAMVGLPAVASAQTRAVDLLFVVDDSTSMADEQEALIASFQRFIDTLGGIEGGLPDLHIGVISSNLGAGPDVINGCLGTGDNGRLLTGPYEDPDLPSCSSRPDGGFLVDLAAPDGTRERNYQGTIADNFACIARLGTKGCGFEQHLESIRRALANPEGPNAGFRRDDAVLAVVVVADEDDCSASDTSVFGTTASEELGPVSSFRCTKFGLRCTPSIEFDSLGAFTNCVPETESPYIADPRQYVDFLRSRVGNPERLVFGVIAGPPTPVAIGRLEPPNNDLAALLSSCSPNTGDAVPAVRLAWMAEQLGGSFGSACELDQRPEMTRIAEQIIAAMQTEATPSEPDAGVPTGDDGGIAPEPAPEEGCGCATGSPAGAATTGIFLLLGLVAMRRRR
jgi:MYXO-CTERM domain-containing protein